MHPFPQARVVATMLLCGLIGSAQGDAGSDAVREGLAAVQRKDYPAALRTLEPLARSGDPVAQWQIGMLYYHGHGVRESDAEAAQWFERAARQGHAPAQFQLGNMHAFGLLPPQGDNDPNRLAAQWYFEAARQGHAEAQYSLGILFLTGSGVLQDHAEALKWVERAALQGHADASAYLKGAAQQAPAPPR